MELLHSLFNWATPTLVPVSFEDVLQHFDGNPQADSMPVLPAAHATPGTETVSVRLCIFVTDFLAGRSSLKVILHQIVSVLAQQDLLLECKPLVDWLKVAVVQENGIHILGVNLDPVLLHL